MGKSEAQWPEFCRTCLAGSQCSWHWLPEVARLALETVDPEELQSGFGLNLFFMGLANFRELPTHFSANVSSETFSASKAKFQNKFAYRISVD